MGPLKILVLLRMVPDVVEELEVAGDGTTLDREFLRLIANESDEHAVEEALILRDRHGGEVVVAAFESPDVDGALAGALAKGADRVLRLTGGPPEGSTREAADGFAATLREVEGLMPVDLVLSGSQAIDDLDGHLAPLVAAALDLPYLGLVTAVEEGEDGSPVAFKEYAAGVRGRFSVDLPAVLGIQAAESPPRYVPVAKLRAAMQSGAIVEVPSVTAGGTSPVGASALVAPEAGEGAEMVEGDAETVAGLLVELLAGRGIAVGGSHDR